MVRPRATLAMVFASACASLQRGAMLREPVTVCPAGAPVVRAAVRAEPIPDWTEPKVVERDGEHTRFIAGALRGEFEGDALRWGSGRFAETIVHAWRDAQGWVFITDDGLTARADTFLGPLRPVESLDAVRRSPWPPPLGERELERARWEAFVRYRLWLSTSPRVQREDGGAVGALYWTRRGPWELWRVDGATGCVTHAPHRLPGRAGHVCREDGVVGMSRWGETLALVGVTGTEARLHVLEDDLRLTDLGPLPGRVREADRLCSSGIDGRLRLSDDGVHALFSRCDGRRGCDGWSTFDRGSARWRDLDGLPAGVHVGLRGTRAAYYDRVRDRVRIGDISGGAFVDVGPPPFRRSTSEFHDDGTLWWLPGGSLVAQGLRRPGGLSDQESEDEEAAHRRFLWVARGAAAPFRRVREPERAAVFMVDASTGYALRGLSSEAVTPFDLLRTRDAGAHWEVVDVRAGGTAHRRQMGDFSPPRCAGPFCVAEDRLLLPTGAPETPGEEVLDVSAAPPPPPPPSAPEVAARPAWDAACEHSMCFFTEEPPEVPYIPPCGDPVEVLEALEAARPTLDACVDSRRGIGAVTLQFDVRGRLLAPPWGVTAGDVGDDCGDAIARALPGQTPSAGCILRAWIVPGGVTPIDPTAARRNVTPP